ncbi:MAG TPA: hypothetical protein VG734_17115 [Lacunisphaera sp.]|nr:hypothetical protein [Lacunisphaera sp.]
MGWESKNLPGGEFRQAQTAHSAYWIKAENNFSPAYPTPVLGKPWSIPMEFPLYQWTVVITGKATGWGLTKAGRAVSIACFYLCLPALFLLLARWRVAPAHRWLVLAVVVTCPFYLFYARAFLMETMALMFSLWFWVAFERAVAERSKAWLAVAILAGAGAGLVKVTTFMLYLLPAGWWAVGRLWTARKTTWKIDVAWMAGAVAVPFAATLWWLHFADATKAQNPLAVFLTSDNMTVFNFGNQEIRWSAELWAAKWRIIREELSWWPVLAGGGLLAVVGGRARWRDLLGCLAAFGSVLVIFPLLYARHEYYFLANAVLLLLALGLALVALAEGRLPRVLVVAAACLILGGQGWRYLERYYPTQRAISRGGSGLSDALRTLTDPEDVIVILGQDWNSILPYYAQRRALMFRDDIGRDGKRVEAALAALEGHKIGALILAGQPDGQQWLIDRAAARGLEREPLIVWHDCRVYLPAARKDELIAALQENGFHEVHLAPGVPLLMPKLDNRWIDLASLPRWQRGAFAAMQPQPVRFFSRFGPNTDGSSGTLLYGAHPITRLVFALPAGRHVLRTTLQMPLDAYRNDLQDAEATDGVEVSLHQLTPVGHPLMGYYFNPRHNREDRGVARPLEFRFELEQAGEIELYFGPGPANKDTRDWIQMGPLTIE